MTVDLAGAGGSSRQIVKRPRADRARAQFPTFRYCEKLLNTGTPFQGVQGRRPLSLGLDLDLFDLLPRFRCFGQDNRHDALLERRIDLVRVDLSGDGDRALERPVVANGPSSRRFMETVPTGAGKRFRPVICVSVVATFFSIVKLPLKV